MNEQTVRIEVVRGPDQGRIFDVPADGFTVGRALGEAAVDCALTQDLSVSRLHLRGQVRNGRIAVEDWPDPPSKAGLVVQGKRVPCAILKDGETVTLGRSVLVFRLSGTPKRIRVSLSSDLRRWAWAGLCAVLLTACAALGRTLMIEPGSAAEGDGVPTAWAARCGGDLQQAMRLLRDAGADSGRRAEVKALERECRRYAKLFAEPRMLEESLRLDEARDAWTRLAMTMPTNDPLRQWVETGCVARLNRQLAELRP